MSNVGGFGTMFYGWRHAPDGTATATTWVTAWWLPLIPLRRQRLRVLTDFTQDARNTRAVFGGLILTDHYAVLDRLPLSGSEVAMTYFKTFVGLPLLLLGPLLVIVAIMKLLQAAGVPTVPGSPAFAGYVAGFGLVMLNFLYQLVRLIRRARGWQPGAS